LFFLVLRGERPLRVLWPHSFPQVGGGRASPNFLFTLGYLPREPKKAPIVPSHSLVFRTIFSLLKPFFFFSSAPFAWFPQGLRLFRAVRDCPVPNRSTVFSPCFQIFKARARPSHHSALRLVGLVFTAAFPLPSF